MKKSRIKKPEQVGSVLEDLFHQLGLSDGIKQQKALHIWQDAVGETVARISAPEKIEHGRLFVRIESGPWRQELHYHKQRIIERLNGHLQEPVIKDIIFI